jgi:hypothetical protein
MFGSGPEGLCKAARQVGSAKPGPIASLCHYPQAPSTEHAGSGFIVGVAVVGVGEEIRCWFLSSSELSQHRVSWGIHRAISIRTSSILYPLAHSILLIAMEIEDTVFMTCCCILWSCDTMSGVSIRNFAPLSRHCVIESD